MDSHQKNTEEIFGLNKPKLGTCLPSLSFLYHDTLPIICHNIASRLTIKESSGMHGTFYAVPEDRARMVLARAQDTVYEARRSDQIQHCIKGGEHSLGGSDFAAGVVVGLLSNFGLPIKRV